MQANWPMQVGHSFAEMMAVSRYHTMVCLSVEAISIRLPVREKHKFCVDVEDMRTIWTVPLNTI